MTNTGGAAAALSAGVPISSSPPAHIQNVSRLAVQRPANGLQLMVKRTALAWLFFRMDRLARGDVHPLGQLVQAHFSLCHHHIQVDYNRMVSPPKSSRSFSAFQLRRLAEGAVMTRHSSPPIRKTGQKGVMGERRPERRNSRKPTDGPAPPPRSESSTPPSWLRALGVLKKGSPAR